MFPQLDPNEATYLARIIVSILGVLIFLALAIWMIRRKQAAQPTIPKPAPASPVADTSINLLAELNPLTTQEREKLFAALQEAYHDWKAERLLQSQDGHQLFLRTGVEKSGLRYQLVATTQVQAFAILVSVLMAETDQQASVQAEALFASVLAHPAYLQPELSSWKYLPDLPRSPRLDPDPHAEAWLIHAITLAQKRWPSMNRFNYAEIIPERLRALQKHAKTLEAESVAHFPFTGYLGNRLMILDASLDWSGLGGSREQFFADFGKKGYLKSEPVTSKLGMNLLQLGFLALLGRDPVATLAIRNSQLDFQDFIEDWLKNAPEQSDYSRLAVLGSIVPALLTLQDQALNEQVWQALLDSQPDKNDGLGATLRLLGMALLSGTGFF